MLSQRRHPNYAVDGDRETPRALKSVRLLAATHSIEQTTTQLLPVPPFECGADAGFCTMQKIHYSGNDPAVQYNPDILYWIRLAVLAHAYRQKQRVPSVIELHPDDYEKLLMKKEYYHPRLGQKGWWAIPYVTTTATAPGTIVCRTYPPIV